MIKNYEQKKYFFQKKEIQYLIHLRVFESYFHNEGFHKLFTDHDPAHISLYRWGEIEIIKLCDNGLKLDKFNVEDFIYEYLDLYNKYYKERDCGHGGNMSGTGELISEALKLKFCKEEND